MPKISYTNNINEDGSINKNIKPNSIAINGSGFSPNTQINIVIAGVIDTKAAARSIDKTITPESFAIMTDDNGNMDFSATIVIPDKVISLAQGFFGGSWSDEGNHWAAQSVVSLDISL